MAGPVRSLYDGPTLRLNALAGYRYFMLNEGQTLLAQASYVPVSKKIPSPFSNVPLKFIDPVKALDMQEKWMRSFDEMIVKRAK